MTRNPLPLLSGLLALLAAGCGGGDMGKVSGTVKLDGQPLSGAMVQFEPQEGDSRPSMGMTDEDGYYELRYTSQIDGAVVGKHKVRISTGTQEDDKVIPEKVPAKYNVNTTLVEEVTSGSQTIDFNLDSQGAKVSPGTGTGGTRPPPGPDVCSGFEEEEDS